MIRAVILSATVIVPGVAVAQGLEVQPVAEGVWAIVGEKEQRSPENLANNATFGLVVTEAGAVLIDPGGSWKGAEALHAAVRTVTDQSVIYVIDTGGQDHRWLGNGYWQGQGATVIASEDAVADQRERGSMQMTALAQFLGDALDGTEPSYADVTFEMSCSPAISSTSSGFSVSGIRVRSPNGRRPLKRSRRRVRRVLSRATDRLRPWNGRAPTPTTTS